MTNPTPRVACYNTNAITVTTTPTLIASVSPDVDIILVQNTSDTAVYLGGPDVTPDGDTQGFTLPPGDHIEIPSMQNVPNQLYAATADGEARVIALFPTPQPWPPATYI